MTLFINKLKELGFLQDVHLTIAQVDSLKVVIEDDSGPQDWQIIH